MNKFIFLVVSFLFLWWGFWYSWDQIVEYKKIDPTKYKIILHNVIWSIPLVFSDSFHEWWKVYLQDYNNEPIDLLLLNKYKILDWNQDDQSSIDELRSFVSSWYISSIWDWTPKQIVHKKWENDKEVLDYIEDYYIDFISKEFHWTIQNDNLSDWNIYDTWFKSSLSDWLDHKIVNWYANGWDLNIDEICKDNSKCIKNIDGTYDVELIVEFRPQRLFYLWLWISWLTFVSILIYLIFDYFRKRKIDKN